MRTDAPGVLGVEAETLHILREAAIPRRRGGATDIGGHRCGTLHTEIKERRIRHVKARILGVGKNGFGGRGEGPPEGWLMGKNKAEAGGVLSLGGCQNITEIIF